MLKSIFSLLFFGWVTLCLGQADSVKARVDSSRKKPSQPIGFRIGVDISRLFLTVTQSRFNGFEVSADLNRGQLLYEAHVGYASQSKALSLYTAMSKGVYYSAGIGKNIFQNSDNILMGGVRLAGSRFTYQPTDVQTENPFSGATLTTPISESKCNAAWVEALGSMRAGVTSWLMMGFEVRFKVLIHSSTMGYTPYSIPGYGLYRNKNSLGFNYFVYVNLPVKK